jgi:hypothetical protein
MYKFPLFAAGTNDVGDSLRASSYPATALSYSRLRE